MKSENSRLVDEYIKRNNPYLPHTSIDIDLRAYSRFIREHRLKSEEITEEIMEQFRVKKEESK